MLAPTDFDPASTLVKHIDLISEIKKGFPTKIKNINQFKYKIHYLNIRKPIIHSSKHISSDK